MTEDFHAAMDAALESPVPPTELPGLAGTPTEAIPDVLRALNARWRVSEDERAKLRWSRMDAQLGGDGLAPWDDE